MNIAYANFDLYNERELLRLNIREAVDRMGDKETYLEIAHYFAEHLPDSLEKLQEAFDASDLALATRLANSLKSNCATVGAESMRERCLTLEKLCRDGDLAVAKELFATMVPKLRELRQRLLSLDEDDD